MISFHHAGSAILAEVIDPEQISGPEDLLDIMADARYNDSDSLVIYAKDLHPDFFDLKTRMAGDILQKFSNYRMKLSIVGDFSNISSKALNDFIRESNRTGIITFVGSLKEAISRLSK